MPDLRTFLGETSTLHAPLQYEFNGVPQPDSFGIFLQISASALILYGAFQLPAGSGKIPIMGYLGLQINQDRPTGTLAYQPVSALPRMSAIIIPVEYSTAGSIIKLTPGPLTYHGDLEEELKEFFENVIGTISYYTIQPVPGASGKTNTQLFADVGGFAATTVLVPGKP